MIKVMIFLITCFAGATALAQIPQDLRETQIRVRTNDIGSGKIVAVTNDGRFFAIVCENNFMGLATSSADLVFQDPDGDLTIDNGAYKASGRIANKNRSAWASLDERGVSEICNHPNGMYVLQLRGADGKALVEYVSGQTLRADSGKSRGF
jgi:hypothetical protein